MRLAAFVIGLCACLAFYAQAQAQAHASSESPLGNDAAAPSAEELAAGREHFKRAGEHYRAGRYREALQSLRLADASVPSPELWFNMGKAHEQLGEVDSAVEHYKLYLEARPDAPDAPKVRARVAALTAALEQRPRDARSHAALRIDAAEAGIAVRLDGESIGSTPIDSLIWVEPGEHVLEAEREGHAPFRAEIAAPAGAMVIGSIETVRRSSARALERSEHALSPASARRSAANAAVGAPVWISGGAAVASLVASAAARGVGEAQRSDGDLDASRSAGTVADVTLASALASSAVAAILYLVTSDTERAERPQR
jgi:tetratricopeptide (TPR) repeat protein